MDPLMSPCRNSCIPCETSCLGDNSVPIATKCNWPLKTRDVRLDCRDNDDDGSEHTAGIMLLATKPMSRTVRGNLLDVMMSMRDDAMPIAAFPVIVVVSVYNSSKILTSELAQDLANVQYVHFLEGDLFENVNFSFLQY